MTAASASEDEPQGPAGRFADDLLGLDPYDPEVQAFAAHLDRMEHTGPSYTVEGYLDGVSTFADSANRTGGLRRLVSVVVVALILLGVGVAAWNALSYVLATFFG
jgi:hypothetical protein